eukprot:scaffold9198_cov137-Skeletonema_dohrnii-CCMP3373.AAC.4
MSTTILRSLLHTCFLLSWRGAAVILWSNSVSKLATTSKSGSGRKWVDHRISGSGRFLLPPPLPTYAPM